MLKSIRGARSRYSVSKDGLLAAPVAAVQVFSDLSPALRMRGFQRLPRSFRAGALGAEVATWGALAPSLLPHKWATTAANTAVLQGIGHGVATAAVRAFFPGEYRNVRQLETPARLAMTGMTTGMIAMALLRRQ